MKILAIIYLFYMFVSIYLLILTLLLYFYNKKNLYSYEKPTKFYSVSVLIPAYNEQDSIRKTIESVFSVDYPITEVIAINDGSKDATLEILKELKNKYPNLKIINKPNSGKADSLNKALKFAQGELIVVLDADSFPAVDSFKKLIGYFDDDKVGAATAACTPNNRASFFEKLQVIEYKVIAVTRKLLEYIESIYVTPGSLSMYRKKALDDIGGFDSKNLTEDIEATWHLLHNNWKIRMALGAHVRTTIPVKFKSWFKQRRRWAIGGLECIKKYYKTIFRKNMLGYFVLPFFTLGLFLGFVGILIFGYLFFRRFLSAYLLAKYAFISDVPVVTFEQFFITPTIVNYFGIVLFVLFLFFTIFILSLMKDELFEKQSFFNLLFYMCIYLLIYPIVLISALWHMYRGKRIWR